MEMKNNKINNSNVLGPSMDFFIELLEAHKKKREEIYRSPEKKFDEASRELFYRLNSPKKIFLENKIAKLEDQNITGEQLLKLIGFSEYLRIIVDKLRYCNVDEICYKIEVSYFLYKYEIMNYDILQENIDCVLDAYLQKHFEDKALPDDCLNGVFIELLNRNENYKNDSKYANNTICKNADLFFHCLNYIRKRFGNVKDRSKMVTLHNSLVNKLKNKVKDGKYEHIFKFSASFLKYMYLTYMQVSPMCHEDEVIEIRENNFIDAVGYLKSVFKEDINNYVNLGCLTAFEDEYMRFDDSEKEQFIKTFDVIRSSHIEKGNMGNTKINDGCSDFDVAKHKLIECLCKCRKFTRKAFNGILSDMLRKIGLKGCIKSGELFIEPNFDDLSAEKLCNSFDALYTLKATGFENLMDLSALIKYCLDKNIIGEVLLELQEREKKLFSACVNFIVNINRKNINDIITIHNSFIKKLNEEEDIAVQSVFMSSARFLFETRKLPDKELSPILEKSISSLKSNIKGSTDIDCVYVFFNELNVSCESFYAKSIKKLEKDADAYDVYSFVRFEYYSKLIKPFVKTFVEVFPDQIKINDDFYELYPLYKDKVDFLKKTFGEENFSKLFKIDEEKISKNNSKVEENNNDNDDELNTSFLKDLKDDEVDDETTKQKEISSSVLLNRVPRLDNCEYKPYISFERKNDFFEI